MQKATVRDSLAAAVRRGITEGRIDAVYHAARMLGRAVLSGGACRDVLDSRADAWGRPDGALIGHRVGGVDIAAPVR